MEEIHRQVLAIEDNTNTLDPLQVKREAFISRIGDMAIILHEALGPMNAISVSFENSSQQHQDNLTNAVRAVLTHAYGLSLYNSNLLEDSASFHEVLDSGMSGKNYAHLFHGNYFESWKLRPAITQIVAKQVYEESAYAGIQVPQDLIDEWVRQDSEYLQDLTNKEKFLTKRSAGRIPKETTYESHLASLGSWCVDGLKYEPIGGREAFFAINIPYDDVEISGVFPIEMIARFLRSIRSYTPNLTDTEMNQLDNSKVREKEAQKMNNYIRSQVSIEV